MSSEENDCLLCLLPMEPYDDSHPLQCPSVHCHFNCCIDCLEHMIKSTKDDHIEASDGNTFHLFLHCPNCRSNLGPSIRDTVLLRKVDKYSKQAFKDTRAGEKVVEDMLSASELRFKHALENDEDIASAIEAAKHREDDFFGRGVEVLDEKDVDLLDLALGHQSMSGSFDSRQRSGSVWSFDDEEGFEADLTNGPHNSFIFRHHSTRTLSIESNNEPTQKEVEADSTLLSGLDAFMTDEEKQFMTAMLISGDTDKLAAATEMMNYVSALSQQGMKPSVKRQRSSVAASRKNANRSMLESIKEVIKEGNEARRLEEEKDTRHAAGFAAKQLTTAGQFGGVAGGRRKLKHQVDMEMRMQIEYMKLHPLPLRMPKYAEVTATRATSKSLTFVDDVWNGTVLDAFSKITVNKTLLGRITVTKQHAESVGIRNVIEAGNPTSPTSKGKGYIDTQRARVLIASISRELGRQGIVKGDVLTHFNGEAFAGTADELKGFIERRFEGEVMTFVFNADSAVAEALKRRSMIPDDK